MYFDCGAWLLCIPDTTKTDIRGEGDAMNYSNNGTV
jgi:hypothetical protein